MMLFLKNLLFTVFVPGTVAGFLPYRIASRSSSAPPLPAYLLLAAPLFIAGVTIYLWCLWDFAVTGRGTPAPIDPPKQLIVRGLYRYVRNPIYIGVLLIIAGWVVAYRSGPLLRYGVAVAILFHLFVVLVEEPLGEGIPLIAARHLDVSLQLRSCRHYSDGVVRLHYSVLKARPRKGRGSNARPNKRLKLTGARK